ncbi:MAG: hypothetical protein R3E79_11890 [Caldilineaceae bacterium]
MSSTQRLQAPRLPSRLTLQPGEELYLQDFAEFAALLLKRALTSPPNRRRT